MLHYTRVMNVEIELFSQQEKGQFGDEIAPIDVKEQKKSVMDQLQDVASLVFTGRIFDHMCDHVEVGLGLKELHHWDS